MDEQQDALLHERVAYLETTVQELQRSVEALYRLLAPGPAGSAQETPIHQPPVRNAGPPRPPAPPSPQRKEKTPRPWVLENLLNKIGIGLLLFGVVFLFKYSIDQGWITPPIRVAFGAALGTTLLAAGLRIAARRRPLSQVLLGGGIAALYVTVFAAHQLYGLVSYPVAFASMALVTLLAFSLSIRQEVSLLSLIGTLGGLGTPFLLYTESGSLPGLVGYTCLILTGTTAIYMSRGWQSLLFTYVIGGYLALLTGYLGASAASALARQESMALQFGFVYCWLAFWIPPVVRDLLQHRRPERWPSPTLQVFKGVQFVERPALALTLSSPLLTLVFSRSLWTLPEASWGWIALGGSLIYGVGYGYLRRPGRHNLAQAHGFAAVLLLTVGLSDLLHGAALLFALSVEAALLYGAAHRLSDDVLTPLAHILLLIAGLSLAERLLEVKAEAPVLVNLPALAELGVIAVGLGLSATLPPAQLRQAYRLSAHLLFLGWLFKELSALPNGQGYVTLAWGVYTVLLLVLGFRLNAELLRKTALATLLLIVAKLFIVDLAEVSALWRILLFLSFGGVLLLLSYFAPRLWKGTAQPADRDAVEV